MALNKYCVLFVINHKSHVFLLYEGVMLGLSEVQIANCPYFKSKLFLLLPEVKVLTKQSDDTTQLPKGYPVLPYDIEQVQDIGTIHHRWPANYKL